MTTSNFLYCIEGSLSIDKFLILRTVSSTLSIGPNVNRIKELEGQVQSMKRSRYSLAYTINSTWWNLAELSYCWPLKAAVNVKAVQWYVDLSRTWKTCIHSITPLWMTLGKSLTLWPWCSYLLHGENEHCATLQKYKNRLIGNFVSKETFPYEIFDN